MSSTNIINPKPCIYNCNTRIYWNNEQNAYFEVFSGKKHICPNRANGKSVTQSTTNTINKPNYYNKFAKQPKPKMSNSFELLTGPITDIQKKYEILSDLVTEANGKVHGSQSHIGPNNSTMSLIVYYEVPVGQREECKQKFENYVTNMVVLQQRN